MSTRANVIVKDDFGDELFFYRHSDGYPEGALPTLKRFMRWVKEGKIRSNASQAAGWLVMIGANEYNYQVDYDGNEVETTKLDPEKAFTPDSEERANSWKVGAYEPTSGIHGDIEYLYILDLPDQKIEVRKTPFGSDREERGHIINVIEEF